MTEFDLIEIAKRFRMLEDVMEQTKPHIGAARRRAETELRILQRTTANSNTLSRIEAAELTRLEKLIERLTELPDELDNRAELCREDLTRMSEEIRRGFAK